MRSASPTLDPASPPPASAPTRKMGQDWHDLRSLNGLGFLREAAVNWSLEGAYDAYPQIEEEFSAALDESLSPRDPSMLLDLVAEFGLAPGSVAVDVGCGEAGRGSQSGFRRSEERRVGRS